MKEYYCIFTKKQDTHPGREIPFAEIARQLGNSLKDSFLRNENSRLVCDVLGVSKLLDPYDIHAGTLFIKSLDELNSSHIEKISKKLFEKKFKEVNQFYDVLVKKKTSEPEFLGLIYPLYPLLRANEALVTKEHIPEDTICRNIKKFLENAKMESEKFKVELNRLNFFLCLYSNKEKLFEKNFSYYELRDEYLMECPFCTNSSSRWRIFPSGN